MASRRLLFHIVDVFAETAYAGNQLAVFHGDMPDDTEMQRIAREINFAETTFLLDPDTPGDTHRVRIFTPEAEVPFAGHPTLGSVHVLRTVFGRGTTCGDGMWRMNLSLAAGVIPVVWSEIPDDPDAGLYSMTQRQPEFGEAVTREDAARWLGMPVGDVSDEGPCRMVSTGLPFLIVPLASLDAVRRASLSKEGAKAAAAACGASGVLVFAREGREPGQDLSVRVFVDELGIPEDPATGSAHGCLVAWMLQQRSNGTGSRRQAPDGATIRLVSGQGHEIGRPSVLHLRGRFADDRCDIEVGGRCRTVAEGRWI